MVKASDLVIKGNSSNYSNTPITIQCFKKISSDKTYLPCRFSKKKKQFSSITLPVPKIDLYPQQITVIDEFWDRINRQKDQGTYTIFGHIHTGFGKTYTFYHFVYSILSKGLTIPPILIIVDSDAVRQTWIKSCIDIFGIEPYVACGSILGKHNICIVSKQLLTLHKFGRNSYSHYGIVCVDEADTICTQNMVDELIDMSPQYLVGLTATIKRGDGMEKVLDIFWGPRSDWVVRLREFGAEYNMDLHILHTSFKVDSIYNKKATLDWMAMSQVVANIYDRNLLIRNLCLMNIDKKILILCKRKEHVETLVSMFNDVGLDTATYYDKDKTYFDANVLIATYSKAGRGYDDKNTSASFDGRRFDMIILTMTMKNADQAIGRSRNNYYKVYLLVDDNPTMKNHASDIKNTNAKRGAKIIEDYV